MDIGLGNSIIPLKDGYKEATQEYRSDYLDEVESLGNPNFTSDSVSYSLYIRFISEFGFILLITAIVYMFIISRKTKNIYLRNYIFILLYLYIQFESYAFYTIWLYIVLLNKEKEKLDKE